MTSLFRRHPRGRPPHPDVLTPAEWRVLEELRRGYSNPEIAARLGLTLNTVKTHVSSMLAKLDLHDRTELAGWQGRPASASRSAPGGLLSFLVSKRGAFAATAASGAVVAAFVLAMYAGRDDMTQPESAGPSPGVEATPTVAATPGVVSLADLGLPPGRIFYLCDRRWCAVATDGRGNVELSALPQNVVEIAPSPEGARLAYFEHATDGRRWLGVANIDGTQPRRLAEARPVHDPVPPVWSPDGRTIYVEHGSTIEGIGGPTAILAVDATSGEVRVLVDNETSGYGHAVSPDGTTVAFSSDPNANLDVFTVPASGGRPRRLTTDPSAETSPSWTSDGRIVYVGHQGGRPDILVMNADGSGRKSLTDDPPGGFVFPVGHRPPPISPDSQWVAFQSERTSSIELYIARTDGSTIRPITNTARGNLGLPVWSPDSSYLAYFAVIEGQRGMWITRIADGATAYFGDGQPAAWLP